MAIGGVKRWGVEEKGDDGIEESDEDGTSDDERWFVDLSRLLHERANHQQREQIEKQKEKVQTQEKGQREIHFHETLHI